MEVINEPLPGLLVIQPDKYKDERGFFLETWQKKRYKDLGISEDFVQDNWSRSKQNVLRGLHYQKENPQGKLVSVRNGSIFDVVVDIRKNSKTFGKWYGKELNDRNNLQLYIPQGFAHGFSVLSKIADFCYKCTEYYNFKDEAGIIWNDPELNIDWKIESPIVSEKDKQLPSFRSIILS